MMKDEDLPPEEEMVSEEEVVEGVLPFAEYGKDSEKIRVQIKKLEKEYDEREKVINHIMEYGTGIESEKALRMYPTATLRKWEDSLESYRKGRLPKK
jgi:hypothetical protein